MFVQIKPNSFLLYKSIVRFSLDEINQTLIITTNTGQIIDVIENAETVFNNLYKCSVCLLLDGSIRLADS